MQQGKVLASMPVRMGLDRLSDPSHNRVKDIVLVEPTGKQMHTYKRQMRRDVDNRGARGNRLMAFNLTRATLAPIAPPPGTPPVDMAKAYPNRSLPLCGLIKKHPAWARRFLLEQAPQQGLLNFIKLPSRTKGWTGSLIEVTMLRGELHDFILLT
jgi:hypothetical protein